MVREEITDREAAAKNGIMDGRLRADKAGAVLDFCWQIDSKTKIRFDYRPIRDRLRGTRASYR